VRVLTWSCAPRQVKDLDSEKAGSASAQTIKQVDLLYEQLTRLGRKPVQELVTNPQSLAQTVEHMFHLAFLVPLHIRYPGPPNHTIHKLDSRWCR
jgi:hypothetical protein